MVWVDQLSAHRRILLRLRPHLELDAKRFSEQAASTTAAHGVDLLKSSSAADTPDKLFVDAENAREHAQWVARKDVIREGLIATGTRHYLLSILRLIFRT